MVAGAVRAASPRWLAAPAIALLIASCGGRPRDVEAVEATIRRYDELLRQGYERQNMTWMREVATDEQAQKLYRHMAALGDGGLRMVSALKDLKLVRVDFPSSGEAAAETREVWDFTHYRIATGEKVSEEKDFVYRMAYRLRREQRGWIVTAVDVIAGEATHTTIPWPAPDRLPQLGRPASPAAHPK